MIVVLALAATSALRTSAGPALGACDTDALSLEVTRDLSALYRTQDPDGALSFEGTAQFYASYPLLATMGLRADRARPNPSFLSQSASSIARYYQYLFTTRDRNGNLMIETTIADPDGMAITVEEPGINSLLALDMVSLAQLNVRLRKPMRALFWYEGARTLEQTIVARCFDPDKGYFFPFDVQSERRLHGFYALSALPVLFPELIGDNHAIGLVSHYVLDDTPRAPETPGNAAGSPRLAGIGTPTDAVATGVAMLKCAAMADVLGAAGFTGQSRAARDAGTQAARAAGVAPGAPGSTAYHHLLVCHLSGADESPVFDRAAALEILRDVVLSKRRQADNEIVRTAEAVDVIASVLRNGPKDTDPTKLAAAIRDVFQTISTTRKALKAGDLFSQQDRFDLSGVAAEPALERLLGDATFLLRLAENELFRLQHRKTGLHVSATVLRDRSVIDEEIELQWSIGTLVSPVAIKSATVHYAQQADTLLKPDPLTEIRPGEPITLRSRLRLKSGEVTSLVPLTATLVLEHVDGTRTRYHAMRTVYLENALGITAEFPAGQVLEGSSVPIDIRVTKRVDERVTLRATWFSPAGLRVQEGPSTQVTIDASTDTTTIRFHVAVPTPCRPGRFPFKLKFASDTRDLGTIESSLFRPFEWLFIGPFTATETPMTTPYAPERRVDLYKGYAGIGRRATWQVLPARGYRNDGTVVVGNVVKQRGVSYLYTVVQSGYTKEVPALLSSNAPAALFVNGVRVIDDASLSTREPAYARVALKEGLNDILIKVQAEETSTVFFNLGDERSLAPDEFNNNLWELIDSFADFVQRSSQQFPMDEQVHQNVTLRYADANANSVSVVGSFNGWSPEHTRMNKVSKNAWEITISLAPGRYTYRFLINNRQHVLDPKALLTEPDGYGGRNSVLDVKE